MASSTSAEGFNPSGTISPLYYWLTCNICSFKVKIRNICTIKRINTVCWGPRVWIWQRNSWKCWSLLQRIVKFTYHSEQLLDFVHCSLQLQCCSVLWVFHRDQDMQLIIQMLPIRFASVLLFLRTRKMYKINLEHAAEKCLPINREEAAGMRGSLAKI